jgi:hypothetical protein
MAAPKKPVKPKTAPVLDIKDEMYAADMQRFSFYQDITDEQRKAFSPLPAMKWLSVVDDGSKMAEYYICITNEVVNIGFWEISKHPELQWKLMAAVGTGTTYRHGWIPMAKSRKKSNKLDQFFLEHHPGLNSMELKIIKSQYTLDSFKQLLRDMAMLDSDSKPLIDEFKKFNGGS